LKELLYGEHKVLENLDKKDGKRLHNMMKHLNTETAFSTIQKIKTNEVDKSILDKYVHILRIGRLNETNYNLSEFTNIIDNSGYYPKSK
jgi:hypothetical protein